MITDSSNFSFYFWYASYSSKASCLPGIGSNLYSYSQSITSVCSTLDLVCFLCSLFVPYAQLLICTNEKTKINLNCQTEVGTTEKTETCGCVTESIKVAYDAFLWSVSEIFQQFAVVK